AVSHARRCRAGRGPHVRPSLLRCGAAARRPGGSFRGVGPVSDALGADARSVLDAGADVEAFGDVGQVECHLEESDSARAACASARGVGPVSDALSADARSVLDASADVEEYGKGGQVDCLLEDSASARAAGAAIHADDPLDRAHVPEAPELEVLLEVDQLFAA